MDALTERRGKRVHGLRNKLTNFAEMYILFVLVTYVLRVMQVICIINMYMLTPMQDYYILQYI